MCCRPNVRMNCAARNLLRRVRESAAREGECRECCLCAARALTTTAEADAASQRLVKRNFVKTNEQLFYKFQQRMGIVFLVVLLVHLIVCAGYVVYRAMEGDAVR